jgi:hypothetical protein
MLKLVANSKRVGMDDSRVGCGGNIVQISNSSIKPASVSSTNTFYKISRPLMWLACGDLEKSCEIIIMLDSS